MASFQSLSQFVHRPVENGLFDSICMRCLKVAGRGKKQLEFSSDEGGHQCRQADLARLDAHATQSPLGKLACCRSVCAARHLFVHIRTIIPLHESTPSRIRWLVKAVHRFPESFKLAHRRLLPVAAFDWPLEVTTT